MPYKFLIYISYSYAVPIGNPFAQEIDRRGFTVKWFSDLGDGKTALRGKTNVLDTIQDVINYEPHIVLGATDKVPDSKSDIKVQVCHGFFDLCYTKTPTATSGFKAQQIKRPHFKVVEPGRSKVDPLIPIKTTNLIENTFDKALTFPQTLIDNMNVIINQLHPYLDEKSSHRIIDACISYLYQDKNYPKNKSINIMRKYKMGKRINYLTFKS